MWSAFWADGRAMVTIEASRTTISWAITTIARIPQRLGSGSSVCAGTATASTASPIGQAPFLSCHVVWRYWSGGAQRPAGDDRPPAGPARGNTRGRSNIPASHLAVGGNPETDGTFRSHDEGAIPGSSVLPGRPEISIWSPGRIASSAGASRVTPGSGLCAGAYTPSVFSDTDVFPPSWHHGHTTGFGRSEGPPATGDLRAMGSRPPPG